MKFNFLLLFLFSISCYAQTYRFIYEYHFKKDSTSKEYSKENMVLDINDKTSKFYSYRYIINDSISKNKGIENIVWYNLPALSHNKKSQINQSFFEIGTDFFVIESKDNIQWTILNEIKDFNGVKAQKAIAKFGGRDWIAWFSDEFPFWDGPYKFRGLPGLIIEIKDTQNNFIFSLVENKILNQPFNTQNFLETIGGQNPIKIDETILKKKRIEHFNSPFNYLKEQLKNNKGTTIIMFGKPVKTAQEMREFEKREQERIIKENNPIELDKIIHYQIQ
ncbi:GLPGLI family protein [Riemerella columbina]|uniref:GLPGLI family protein n=1 Tax=Riemerella columbina TaxID=103810 RepID=UPI0026707F7F|nr:GLPGLI family protein [Riemerella columbina]WKS94888.1 GLPGLI family protein [Riemerella columbina]